MHNYRGWFLVLRSLPEYEELVHIVVHKCITIEAGSLARQLVTYLVSTNGERASLGNLNLIIGSLLECS